MHAQELAIPTQELDQCSIVAICLVLELQVKLELVNVSIKKIRLKGLKIVLILYAL